MSDGNPAALVSPAWLARHLGEPHVRAVDASWHLTASGRDARAEFHARHIPGAIFFDLDEIADHGSDLPHMLPSPDYFASAVGALGISNDDQLVVYDATGVNLSAPRVWWTFRVMGHHRVAVLDGGLATWMARGFPVESGASAHAPAQFSAEPELGRVVSLAQMQQVAESGEPQIIDARSPERFAGTLPEPRPGLRSGRIEGAHNVHFRALVDDDGRIKPSDDLSKLFRAAGVDPLAPAVTSCGSGVTACAVAHALYLLGNDDVRVYDGSWAEWGRAGSR